MGNNSKINASEIAYKDINNNVDTLDNILNNSSSLVEQSFSNKSCTHDALTTLKSIQIPAGRWIIVGQFVYNGTNLRYYLNLNNGTNDIAAISSYDNAGIVAGNISTIIEVSQPTTISLNIYPNTKTIAADGYLKAIKNF